MSGAYPAPEGFNHRRSSDAHSALRAIDFPESGGDTIWASVVAAWDGLASPVQARLGGLEARHGLGDGEAFKSKAGEDLYLQAT